jgi:hypothetical protein
LAVILAVIFPRAFALSCRACLIGGIGYLFSTEEVHSKRFFPAMKTIINKKHK